jgi:hypothetical protein
MYGMLWQQQLCSCSYFAEHGQHRTKLLIIVTKSSVYTPSAMLQAYCVHHAQRAYCVHHAEREYADFSDRHLAMHVAVMLVKLS